MSHPPTAPAPPLLDDDVSAADPALRAALAAAGGSVDPARVFGELPSQSVTSDLQQLVGSVTSKI